MFYFIIKEFCSISCIFGKTWLYIVLHDFILTYYSSIILDSFSILLFPKLCWHIGLTPTKCQLLRPNVLIVLLRVYRYLGGATLPFTILYCCMYFILSIATITILNMFCSNLLLLILGAKYS